MFHATSFRSYVRVFIAALMMTFVTGLLIPTSAAGAINDFTVFMTGPTPNPIPAGSAATVSADFWLSTDAGTVTVGLQLNSGPGFGSISLDAVSSGLTNCQVVGASITCDWEDGIATTSPQTINAIVSVDADAAPYSNGQIEATAESATEAFQTYASAYVEAGPPTGSTAFSGTVITTGGVPVAAACVYVLSSSGFVFPAIADTDGNWSATGLPDDWNFAVGAIPPYTGAYGPCADNGPPPVSAPGELQPEFYTGIWIDLADPMLTGGSGNPYDFAVSAGATSFSGSASGLVSCLTTAPSSTVPRPLCVAPVTTTTSSSTTSTTSASGGGGAGVTSTTAAPDTLPVTGASTTGVGIVGALLILLGAGVLRATRSQVARTREG
jgi:hypothetical protein